MEINSLTMFFTVAILVSFVVLVIASIMETPLWKSIYYHTVDGYHQLDEDEDYLGLMTLQESLVSKYNLTIEEANSCINNVDNPKWFEAYFTNKENESTLV